MKRIDFTKHITKSHIWLATVLLTPALGWVFEINYADQGKIIAGVSVLLSIMFLGETLKENEQLKAKLRMLGHEVEE